MISQSVLISIIILCAAVLVGAEKQPAVQFAPNCGTIFGTWETVTERTEQAVPTATPVTRTVAVFRGLPYGYALGRFSPPRPVPGFPPSGEGCWPGGGNVFNATQSALPCVQSASGAGQSEDCLYLDVYVPKTLLEKKSQQLTPVNFYIFGGSLVSGTAPVQSYFSAFTPPSADGGEGTISVTLSGYRLSILGFLGAPALLATGAANLGIQDQIMALRWTRRFIHHFGGDPKAVTLSGQSSGGTSIFALLSCVSCRGLFRSVWSFSGSANITQDAESKLKQDLPILERLGCTSSDHEEQMSCLRQKTIAELFNAVPAGWYTPGIWSLAGLKKHGRDFDGLVFVDGGVVTMPFHSSLSAPHNANVSIVITSSAQESNLVSPPDQPEVANFTTAAQWKDFLRRTWADWGDAEASKIANSLFMLYEREWRVSPLLAYSSINSDYGVGCPSRFLAERSSNKRNLFIGVDAWWPSNNHAMGSCCQWSYHTWQWSMAIFYMAGYVPDAQDIQFSQLVRRQWAALLHTGSPSLPDMDWKSTSDAGPGAYFVWARPDKGSSYPWNGGVSGMMKNFMGEKCNLFRSIGMLEEFWWCD